MPKNEEIDKIKSRKSRLLTLQRITSYGPLVITVLILLVQTFAPNLLNSLPLTASIAILIGSTIFLIWYAETTIQELKEEHIKFTLGINKLEETQSNFISATTSLSLKKLGAVFADISNKTPKVGHLRIYAISSQQILSFLKFNEISIDKCSILLRSFPSDEIDENQDFINQIKLVISDWQRLHKNGRIKELKIRNYDFFPTEYECIFDKDHLILGLYDSIPSDYSKVGVRDALLVRSTSDSGKVMISEFVERFDNLFEVCEANHGDNIVENNN